MLRRRRILFWLNSMSLMLLQKKEPYQKLRALWLKEGAKNTKFFHCVANSNKRNNTVDSLVVNVCLFKFYKNK
jgi:hypothetical protein